MIFHDRRDPLYDVGDWWEEEMKDFGGGGGRVPRQPTKQRLAILKKESQKYFPGGIFFFWWGGESKPCSPQRPDIVPMEAGGQTCGGLPMTTPGALPVSADRSPTTSQNAPIDQGWYQSNFGFQDRDDISLVYSQIR